MFAAVASYDEEAMLKNASRPSLLWHTSVLVSFLLSHKVSPPVTSASPEVKKTKQTNNRTNDLDECLESIFLSG